MKNKKVNKFNGKMIITIMLLLIVVIGGTFAWFTYRSKETALVLSIGDINDSKVIINPYEIRETMIPANVYTSGVYSQVTAINNNSNEMGIKLFYRVNELDDILINNGLKYTIASSSSINGEYTEVSTGDFKTLLDDNEIVIFNSKVGSNTTIYYRVYLWLDSDDGEQSDVQNLIVDIELNGMINILANQPVLDDGMIPVTISADGVVTTIGENDVNWYNYNEQKWANIVLVNENATDSVDGSKSREYYLNNPGTTVLESDILAYYVWIPRYKYKIWTTGVSSTGNEQTIDILFESKDDVYSNGSSVGEYRTHPAFWWDVNSDGNRTQNELLPGIWVGKFETTGTGDKPTVLPNTTSLTNQNVSTQFISSLKFSGGVMNTSTGNVTFSGSDTYGLTEYIDSHMMKNSEWGAVAYLSHSQYGINDEVRINNYYNNGYLTGCGALTENESESTTCGITYGDSTVYPQSTTGNITGVYDMSGGAWDYMMGVLADNEGKPRSGSSSSSNSGFNGALDSGELTAGVNFPNSKYYDLYTSTTSTTACNGGICYGHALSETALWYDDYASFISSSNPWFLRGGDGLDGVHSGAFFSGTYDGYAVGDYSWRSVLLPKWYLDVTLTLDANGGNFISNVSYTSAGEHTYTVPFTGDYKLEVWGAQGGSYNTSIIGGYGGYSLGTINLEKDMQLFINVGGTTTSNSGGYNGGGAGSDNTYGVGYGGGGATHIATVNGELSTLSQYAGNHNSPILIIAGGGGGATDEDGDNRADYGGHGGGFQGTVSIYNLTDYDKPTAGTQIAGGSGGGSGVQGTFGEGGNGVAWAGGGGGGYYGGGGGAGSAGAGGSGYIANNKLTNKAMYCYECTTSSDASTLTYSTSSVSSTPTANYAKSGGGAARITGTAANTSLQVIYGGIYGSLPIPTMEGYNFLGWYTQPEGGTLITEDLIVNEENDFTLYAHWEETSTYTISYDANGGSGAPSSQTKTHDETLTLSSTVPTRSGYVFLGWSTSSTATSATYSAGGSYTANEDATLYAVWVINTYTISYDANGGSGAPSSQTKTRDVTLTLSSTVPTRSGYAFLGWSTSSTATSATYSAGGSYTANEGATLYAVWEKRLYLYNLGNEYTSLTGGWKLYKKDSSTYSVGSLTKGSNYLQLTSDRKEWVSAITVNKINFSGYTKLNYVVSSVSFGSGGWANGGLKTSRNAATDYYVTRRGLSVTGVLNINISAYSSTTYYVDMTLATDTSGTSTLVVTSIYLS